MQRTQPDFLSCVFIVKLTQPFLSGIDYIWKSQVSRAQLNNPTTDSSLLIHAENAINAKLCHYGQTAKTTNSRIFWFCVIGICLSSALWFSNVLLTEFLEGQTVTLNMFKEVDQIQYPNIVICPKYADSLDYKSLEKDMEIYISNFDKSEFYDIIYYVIAGSGIHGMEAYIDRWKDNHTDYLYDKVKNWRANRTWEEFFKFVLDKNGYKCQDLFNKCIYGYQEVSCCDLFHPTYVLKRGRCFRLGEFYQKSRGNSGTLRIHMNELPSNIGKINGTQPQLIMYLSTKQGDIHVSHRLYITKSTWNEVCYQMKKIKMLSEQRARQCANSEENTGIPRCLTDAWLQQQLMKPFNCTFYPYYGKRTSNIRTCNPKTIVQNYGIMNNHISTNHCIPACERDDIKEQKFSSTPGHTVMKIITPYMVQIRFDELRVEIYEEIQSTSVPGFISELGGQVMLYLGMSINTVVQFVLIGANLIVRIFKRMYMCVPKF